MNNFKKTVRYSNIIHKDETYYFLSFVLNDSLLEKIKINIYKIK